MGIEKAQGVRPVLFPYWYAIKPATPRTKTYSVFVCSNFNDSGGDKGVRTPDLYVANVSRYQLCYIPVCALTCARQRGFVVGTAELESATSCMSSKRSNQLSYAPI